jgi:uncharacterized protein (TIGR02001 family)
MNTRYATGLLSLAAVLLAPLACSAQVATRIGVLLPEVSVLSDYRFDGMSTSDGQPSVKASVYLWRPDGWYAGGEVTRVRLDPKTNVELVAYGGRNQDFGRTRLTFEAMAVLYPDQPSAGPGYGYGQVSAKARRSFDKASLTAIATYTPEASYDGGPAWKLAGEGLWQATPAVALSGRLGVYESRERQDRTYWNAGITVKRSNLALDLRYHGTNLSRAQCFYTDWCTDGLAARLSINLPNRQL